MGKKLTANQMARLFEIANYNPFKGLPNAKRKEMENIRVQNWKHTESGVGKESVFPNHGDADHPVSVYGRFGEEGHE